RRARWIARTACHQVAAVWRPRGRQEDREVTDLTIGSSERGHHANLRRCRVETHVSDLAPVRRPYRRQVHAGARCESMQLGCSDKLDVYVPVALPPRTTLGIGSLAVPGERDLATVWRKVRTVLRAAHRGERDHAHGR